jgi:protein-S-isoprenylcysteine O-methyltransferase Ste14
MATNRTMARRADRRISVEGRARMQWTPRHRRIGNLLVAAQFTLIGLCLIPVGPTLGSGQLRPLGLLCLGLAAVVGGLALLAMGSDARVHPVPAATTPLRISGIYAWIRHPMYASVLLATLGVTLSTGRLLSLVTFLALVGVLHVKAEFEDRMLQEKFGWQFSVYASRVPALFPQPWRSHAR